MGRIGPTFVGEEAFGISPLGGNSVVEGEVQGVPLFWDSRVQTWVSDLAVDYLDDRDLSAENAEEYNKEEEFRIKSGYRRL
jgi:hypothetical protein